MSYNNKQRLAHSKDKKQMIIDVALKLINENGYDKVTVKQITDQAGVSKGAFYIHFNSKEDLIEQQINIFYNGLLLGSEYDKYERLLHYLSCSIKHIKESGLKMCQEWFSQSVKANFYGKSKLLYDKNVVYDIVQNEDLTSNIISIYYGALNLWCFSDGEIDPDPIIINYLNSIKERLV